MSDQLRIDLGELSSLSDELSGSKNTFASASTVSGGLADAVGHDGHAHQLGDKVNDFSGGWSIRRGKICDALDAMVKSVTAIHDAFVDVDSQLDQALSGSS
jgi:hypothetical protein